MTINFANRTGLEVIRYLPEPNDFEISRKILLKIMKGEKWSPQNESL